MRHRISYPRRATATVELAVLLPFLVFLFVLAVDWARVFYYSVIVTNSARQGALYASDPIAQPQSPYTSVSDAALADAADLQPPPTVTTNSGFDSAGNSYVDVTVSWQFVTVTNYPVVGSSVQLSRTVRARVAPGNPQ
jgi:Flp pilus assembly protein TadG